MLRRIPAMKLILHIATQLLKGTCTPLLQCRILNILFNSINLCLHGRHGVYPDRRLGSHRKATPWGCAWFRPMIMKLNMKFLKSEVHLYRVSFYLAALIGHYNGGLGDSPRYGGAIWIFNQRVLREKISFQPDPEALRITGSLLIPANTLALPRGYTRKKSTTFFFVSVVQRQVS